MKVILSVCFAAVVFFQADGPRVLMFAFSKLQELGPILHAAQQVIR